ncbi:hypothetical protein K402DRAFT_131441 [Aulographum hederae CBS 113979]|uniref:Uncharacterized protein n=1 Tax=Aulographum hederae CBS 113979 TaxID=1176131 RepID=A0A6G1HF25_9PEZI|nr:hypothetical protein K402DRAFT_131441 [Aulographum hederae CBS 113979]
MYDQQNRTTPRLGFLVGSSPPAASRPDDAIQEQRPLQWNLLYLSLGDVMDVARINTLAIEDSIDESKFHSAATTLDDDQEHSTGDGTDHWQTEDISLPYTESEARTEHQQNKHIDTIREGQSNTNKAGTPFPPRLSSKGALKSLRALLFLDTPESRAASSQDPTDPSNPALSEFASEYSIPQFDGSIADSTSEREDSFSRNSFSSDSKVFKWQQLVAHPRTALYQDSSADVDTCWTFGEPNEAIEQQHTSANHIPANSLPTITSPTNIFSNAQVPLNGEYPLTHHWNSSSSSIDTVSSPHTSDPSDGFDTDPSSTSNSPRSSARSLKSLTSTTPLFQRERERATGALYRGAVQQRPNPKLQNIRAFERSFSFRDPTLRPLPTTHRPRSSSNKSESAALFLQKRREELWRTTHRPDLTKAMALRVNSLENMNEYPSNWPLSSKQSENPTPILPGSAKLPPASYQYNPEGESFDHRQAPRSIRAMNSMASPDLPSRPGSVASYRERFPPRTTSLNGSLRAASRASSVNESPVGKSEVVIELQNLAPSPPSPASPPPLPPPPPADNIERIKEPPKAYPDSSGIERRDIPVYAKSFDIGRYHVPATTAEQRRQMGDDRGFLTKLCHFGGCCLGANAYTDD